VKKWHQVEVSPESSLLLEDEHVVRRSAAARFRSNRCVRTTSPSVDAPTISATRTSVAGRKLPPGPPCRERAADAPQEHEQGSIRT